MYIHNMYISSKENRIHFYPMHLVESELILNSSSKTISLRLLLHTGII